MENEAKTTEENEKNKYIIPGRVRRLNKRAAAASIAAICLVFLLQFVNVMLDSAYSVMEEDKSNALRAGISRTLKTAAGKYDAARMEQEQDLQVDAHIASLNLREEFEDESFRRLREYKDGYTVKVKEDSVILPDALPGAMPRELDAGLFTDEIGSFELKLGDTLTEFAYSEIGDGYYYIKSSPASWDDDEFAVQIMNAVEKAYDSYIILINGSGELIYRSDDFSKWSDEDFNNILNNREDFYSVKYDAGKNKADVIRIESADTGRPYSLFVVRPEVDTAMILSDSALFVTFLIAMLIGALIVWLTEIQRALHNNTMGKKMLERYAPEKLRRTVAMYAAFAVLIVLTAGCISHSIANLYDTTLNARHALKAVSDIVDVNTDIVEGAENAKKTDMEKDSGSIAEALKKYPHMRTGKALKGFSAILNAEFIMVYDHNGNELLTDSDYRGMSLGTEESSPSYALRRLLKGQRSIIVDDVTDSYLEGERILVGTRMDSIEKDHPDDYNVLMIVYDRDRIMDYGSNLELTTVVDSLIASDNVYCVIDEETNKIDYFSNNDIIGDNAVDLGMKEENIRGGFMGDFTLNGSKYYGLSDENADKLVYYAVPVTVLYSGALRFGLMEAVLLLAVLLIVCFILLQGYSASFEKGYRHAPEVHPDDDNSILMPDGKTRLSVDPSKRWMYEPFMKYLRTPEQRARLVLRILLTICVIFIFVKAARGVTAADDSGGLIPFFFSDQWTRGFNLFALTRIIITLSIILVVWTVVVLAVRLASGIFGTKGETISRLVRSISGYIAVFSAIYCTALYLGFDPGALLASVGIIGLALSLGARDLIADVLAGLYIVFEGEFQVGDIIDVGGYRGTVLDIGVRTTKLMGKGDNIKIINNSDIRNVINLTRHNSWCDMEFSVEYSSSFEEIENIVISELPGIGDRHSEILSTPVFKGITALNPGRMTMGVQAECHESDYYRVLRILNSEIRTAMEKHGIRML